MDQISPYRQFKPKHIPNQLVEGEPDEGMVREGEAMYKTILQLMKSYKKNKVDFSSKKVALVHYFESVRLGLEERIERDSIVKKIEFKKGNRSSSQYKKDSPDRAMRDT